MKTFWVNKMDLHDNPTDSRDVLVVYESEVQAELARRNTRISGLEERLEELKELQQEHFADRIQLEEPNQEEREEATWRQA